MFVLVCGSAREIVSLSSVRGLSFVGVDLHWFRFDRAQTQIKFGQKRVHVCLVISACVAMGSLIIKSGRRTDCLYSNCLDGLESKRRKIHTSYRRDNG